MKFTSPPPDEGPDFANTEMETTATATNGHHQDPPQSESQTQPLSFDTDFPDVLARPLTTHHWCFAIQVGLALR